MLKREAVRKFGKFLFEDKFWNFVKFQEDAKQEMEFLSVGAPPKPSKSPRLVCNFFYKR